MISINKLVLAVLVLSLLVTTGCKPSTYPDIKLPQTAQSRGGFAVDSCQGKERCLVYFIAPWCGACHQSMGFFAALNNRLQSNPRVGFRLIVGRDSETAIRKMAMAIPFNVEMDINREASRAFGSGVPAWIVLDQDRSIIKRGSGGFGETSQAVLDYFLIQRAGLKKFL